MTAVASPRAPRGVAVLLTRRCDMACEHCSVVSGPGIQDEPDDETLVARVEAAIDAGARSVVLTGGEPMLREDLVLRLARLCRSRGAAATMTTNGSWGESDEAALRRVRALRRAGLAALTVSYDRYHASFQGAEPALRIARAASAEALPCRVSFLRHPDEQDLESLVEPFRDVPDLRLRFYDLQPVGRGRKLPPEVFRGEVSGFCSAAESPAITDDGRVIACNGPAYFERKTSPLHVGSLEGESMPTLLDRHRDDDVLRAIRTIGPAGLRDLLGDVIDESRVFTGNCDLCLHLTRNPETVARLRERLAEDEVRAAVTARELLIRGARAREELSERDANGRVAARAWIAFARAGAYDPARGDVVFGRADVDWALQAESLRAAGLSRALAALASDPRFRRWAPHFFVERLVAQAEREARLEPIHRHALERIAAALESLGVSGTLLKGCAFLVTGLAESPSAPRRFAGDVDLLVDPRAADDLRRLLLERGFRGEKEVLRTAPHHLAPVSFRGVDVEIHTAVMPPFWGFPDDAARRTRAVAGWSPLRVLERESAFFHVVLHATTHLFANGLKTGWDLARLLEGEPLDAARIASWAEQLPAPRAFWVPARTLAAELALPVSAALLDRAPRDRRERKLEAVAARRFFARASSPWEMNPVSRTGLFLLLHDSLAARGRYVLSLFDGETAQARRSAMRHHREQAWAGLPHQLRRALHEWRQYRALDV